MFEDKNQSSGAAQRPSPSRATLITVFVYFCTTLAWILLSDSVVAFLIQDSADQWIVQSAKGAVFVSLTSFLLYQLISKNLHQYARYEQKLQQSEFRLRMLSEASVECLFILDEDRILDANQSASRQTGYSPEELQGKSIQDLIERPFSHQQSAARFEAKMRTASGWQVPVEVAFHRAEQLGSDRLLVSIRDISELNYRADQVRRLAFYDQLTGLPNENRIQQLIRDMEDPHSLPLVTVLISVVNLPDLNDTYGQTTVDELIATLCERLRRTPDGLAGRLNGNHLFLGTTKCNSRFGLLRLVRKTFHSLKQPVRLSTVQIFPEINMGVHVDLSLSFEPESILRNARTALYKKTSEPIRFFRDDMQHKMQDRLVMEEQIRRGLPRSEFSLHYQPRIEMKTGLTIGYEALLRWYHPDRGYISPLSFIPVAEDSGLILTLGNFVIEAAVMQLVRWHSSGNRTTISVNATTRQLLDGALLQSLLFHCRKHQMDPSYIEVEITEGGDDEETFRRIHELQNHGYAVALDDFGTGHSSLSYLNKLHVNSVKIDRSLIENLETELASRAIVEAVIRLAGILHFSVVAEGIENNEQSTLLRELGCQYGQGYLFGRPAPAEAVRLH